MQELRDWKFALDQGERGEGNGWYRADYPHEAWLPVEAYSCWENYDPSMADYRGCGWFWTEVPVGDPSRRLALVFDRIGGRAKVFVNGKMVGGTECRYLPFRIELGRAAEETGRLSIAVLVDNRFRGVYHLPGANKVEWMLYGGLTHHVYLEEEDPVRIAKMQLTAGADGRIRWQVLVENADTRPFHGHIRLEVADLPECVLEEEVVCGGASSLCLERETTAKTPQLWSPEAPNLYTAAAVLIDEKGREYARQECRTGFRTVEVRGAEILLNGKPLLIKGVNRYDEIVPYGICPPEEKIREELKAIKDLGCNLIRTHYPQDPVHYRIADEIGLMYLIEIPLNLWHPSEESAPESFEGLWREAEEVTRGIWRHFSHHPSWVIWSCGNECFLTKPALLLFRRLADTMRSLKTGRLITLVTHSAWTAREGLDFCDVISHNNYAGAIGSYTRSAYMAAMKAVLKRSYEPISSFYPDKPLLITEFGLVSLVGFHGSKEDGHLTEEYAAAFIESLAEELMKNPNLCGMILWCYADYRHERGFFTCNGMRIDATAGPYGLVSQDRREKTVVIESFRRILKKLDEECG